jgi:UDP-N-acetyl-D-mannosaminuronate dehydrogenase
MKKHRRKLNEIAYKLIERIQNYASTDTKVCFMGLSLYPNTGHMFNWDIAFLYKALSEVNITARMHDPHIRGSEALAAGIWLGRQDEGETWTHSHDVIILSCPHVFYMTNITKIAMMLKDSKPCLFLDLFGVMSRIGGIGENISIVDFSTECGNYLIGGLIPINRPKLLK